MRLGCVSGRVVSDFGASPDPQIIQLRGLLLDALRREQSYSALPRRETIEALQLALGLTENLIEQYPALTASFRLVPREDRGAS